MVDAFIRSDSMARALIADSQLAGSQLGNSHSRLPSMGTLPASAESAEQFVSSWIAQLLKHFSVQRLDAASDQEIADYLAAFTESCGVNLHCDLYNRELIAELKRSVMRIAGAQLDDAFVSMTPDIIDEADVVPISLSIEGRQLYGVRYKGEVYRKIEEFKPCHRLQSYCLAQTLRERKTAYVITRSEQRFAVWVNVSAVPI